MTARKTLEFTGYKNATGRMGVRNDLLVLSATGLTQPVAQRVARGLRGAKLVSFPYGMGLVGEDLRNVTRAMVGLAQNPNVGAVLVLSADRTCLDTITQVLHATSKPHVGIALDEVGHDALSMTDKALRAGAGLMRDISKRQRSPAGLDQLCVGLECGLSDPTSGIAANPLIGRVSDRIVAANGTVIMGETLEWLGVEHELAARAVSPQVAAQISAAVLRRERVAAEAGIDLTGINPNRRNIEEGLTTIEEKASGSSAKSGTAPISGVLRYGECPIGPGLWLMDAPSYTPESLTGYAAAGAQIALFSTGSGNSYTSALMPTLKLTANPQTAARLKGQIDHDCSDIITGSKLSGATDALLGDLLDMASGMLSFGEILSENGETISRFGEAL